MLTISEAADRAGLNPDVLRAWERRYGIVRPARSPSGYRLYTEADIELLLAMQRLIAGGMKPREAALVLSRRTNRPAAPASGTLPSRAGGRGGRAEQSHAYPNSPAAIGQPTSPAGAASHPGRPHPDPAAESSARLLSAAARLDPAALSGYFDELSARGTFEAACDDYLFPALRDLGAAWADGALSVAGEHVASAAALRWLGAHYRAAARDTRPTRVLVGLSPGARHELGALAQAVALRRSGVNALYLGPDLPVEDWLTAIRTTGARLAVLGAVIASDLPEAERVATAISSGSPEARLAFGGRQAGALAAHGTVLPAGLRAATAAVLELLAD